jgi:hypothetical protein
MHQASRDGTMLVCIRLARLGKRGKEERRHVRPSEHLRRSSRPNAGVERYEAPIFEVSLTGGGEERGFMSRLTGR